MLQHLTSSMAPLSGEQKTALAHLHTVAQQFEGVFVGMVLKEMRSTVAKDTLFGNSPTTDMFSSMLDDQRSQAMAKTGSFGIAKMIEAQMKTSVLANATRESKAGVPAGGL
jgi:Rod binding domain-containing protein